MNFLKNNFSRQSTTLLLKWTKKKYFGQKIVQKEKKCIVTRLCSFFSQLELNWPRWQRLESNYYLCFHIFFVVIRIERQHAKTTFIWWFELWTKEKENDQRKRRGKANKNERGARAANAWICTFSYLSSLCGAFPLL